MNKNIEVEGGEIAIRNSHGDLAIIPKDKINWVKQKLSEGCHGCIDSLVETLPVVNNYAQDGTVFPNEKQPIVLITPSGRKVETDTDSDFYRTHYNSKLIGKQNEDKSWNLTDEIYQGKPLPEVVVASKIQPNTFADYNNQFNKNNPKDKFLQKKQEEHNKEFYSAPFWAQQAVGGYNDKRKQNDLKRDNEEYTRLQNDFIAEKLLKRTPFEGMDNRVKWLEKFSPKELETIKNSKYTGEIEPSIWSKFEQGLLSIGNMGSPVEFKSKSLTQEEAKKEDNPLNILQPLSIPSKMVQSAYKKDYSFKDALKGKQNNANIGEDIITDPLNLVGLGIWGKLSKANNFAKLEDAYQAIKTLDKTTLEKQIGTTLSNDDWQYLYRVQEKGFDIEKPTLKAIEERVASGKGKWYDNNILNNPELRANMESRDRYYGQWFEQDPKRLDYYLADKENIEILRAKVPKEILEQYRIDNFDPEIAKKWSLSHETEYIIPKDLIQKAEKFKRNDWQKLIDEHEAIKSKVLNKTDNVAKPIVSSVDNMSKQVTKPAWKIEELPGLHLKSTMQGEAISKIVEPKTGLINTEQALGIIGKESGGADKVALIKQGLGENIPKKMDYNEFRKVVQDQLIPLEHKMNPNASSAYGINRIGYNIKAGEDISLQSIPEKEYIPEITKWLDEKSITKGVKFKSVKDTFEGQGTLRVTGIKPDGSEFYWIVPKRDLPSFVTRSVNIPLENQTLTFSNKSKFGRGSSAHGNPEETLGHIHFLRDAETPDVLTVTQIQSDAFQGTHRIMPKNTPNATALERQQKSLVRMQELQERNKSVLNKMKTEGVDEAGLPVQDYQIKQFEDLVKAQEQSNLFKKAEIENFTQKQLLDKNHQERYLQELVDYAGKRGDVNKVRVPTSETAAKVQGYSKNTATGMDEMGLPTDLSYSPEHQTILKKYSEQPKTIKKLFGVEPKIVTDSKGNTWYEFDIPKKFKEGKGEIKAFQVIPPAIGSAAYLQSQQQNKSEQ